MRYNCEKYIKNIVVQHLKKGDVVIIPLIKNPQVKEYDIFAI